jgi:YihY family inner membrane protein
VAEQHAAPHAAPERATLARRAGQALKDFYVKAYEENITGLSGMVAYNLLLSLFPLALLALFIASRILRSGELEASVFQDLQRLFPGATETTITNALERVKSSSASFGVVTLVTAIWFGSSFWGALDTACCRIYHVDCRSWVQQKRFGVVMLVVVLLFMAATVAVPALQSLLTSGAHDLPFGLSDVGGLVYGLSLAAGLALLFAILCLVYWTVPNRLVPWHAIWPGAAAATVAIAVVDYAFPAYLNHITTIARVGTTFVFVLIALIWFYALALIILAGAVINAMRFELEDTGEVVVEEG